MTNKEELKKEFFERHHLYPSTVDIQQVEALLRGELDENEVIGRVYRIATDWQWFSEKLEAAYMQGLRQGSREEKVVRTSDIPIIPGGYIVTLDGKRIYDKPNE